MFFILFYIKPNTNAFYCEFYIKNKKFTVFYCKQTYNKYFVGIFTLKLKTLMFLYFT